MTKQAFDLTYHTDHGTRTERCYLLRHHPDLVDPDPCFSVVRLANDRIIATEGTKQDAISAAMIDLHQWADFGTPCPAMG